MTPLESSLLAAIEAEPDDPLVRLAYADWLEEHGRDGEAAGWRWIVAERRVPLRGASGRYRWAAAADYSSRHPYAPAAVAPEVYRRLTGDPSSTILAPCRAYPSRLAAEQDLARAYGLAHPPS